MKLDVPEASFGAWIVSASANDPPERSDATLDGFHRITFGDGGRRSDMARSIPTISASSRAASIGPAGSQIGHVLPSLVLT